MAELSADALRRALEGGVARVLARVEELNRINVFPVPDGDTGSNLAHTLGGAFLRFRERAREGCEDARALMEAWAEALVREARGNSGVLFAQYFTSLAQALPSRPSIPVEAFARALQEASRELYRVVSTPVEGTLLTVAREVAEEARNLQARDPETFFARLVRRAREALARTPELLPVLREHGVVDAGAEGFTLFVEGMKEALFGQRVTVEHLLSRLKQAGIRRGGREGEALRYRFCTEALVRPRGDVRREAVRQILENLGDSLLVVATPRWIHVHIHTNHPEEVFARLSGFGVLVETKADDMEAQRKRDLPALLMDTTLDLPPDVAFKIGVIRIPVHVMVEGQTFEDGVTIHPEDVLRVQREGKTLTTSQPAPRTFEDAFRKALQNAPSALSFHLSGRLSGTVHTARGVAAALGVQDRVHVVDTHLLSFAGGFLLWQAYDRLAAGEPLDAVLAFVERQARESFALLSVHDLSYLIRSGRLSGGAGVLARTLGLKVILEFSGREEILRPIARLLPFQSARKRLIQEALKRMDPDRVWDVAVVHTGELGAFVEETLEALGARRRIRRRATGRASSAVAAHIGPWGMGILAVPAPEEGETS